MDTAQSAHVPGKADGRREVGERTRERLLQATRQLLAERGEDAIRLRDVTDAAQVNVAAVNYHFGSLKALYRAAIKEAIDTILGETIEQLSELSDDATLEEIVAAWIRPVIAARSGPCNERRAFMRITARAANDPPQELCAWMTEAVARVHEAVSAHLRHALPHVPEPELRFRIACAAGILHSLRTDGMQAELGDKSAEELERYLVPVIGGALGAGVCP
ncbi:MAG TPA: TetR family transcriptional regulator [Solirubrobacteraceae bacterium]|nr:TetR family transcriptional regulator [Solirubrobacteraceae bacterium]